MELIKRLEIGKGVRKMREDQRRLEALGNFKDVGFNPEWNRQHCRF